MEENIYYHIQRISQDVDDDKWHEGATISIGNEHNLFYKNSTEFEAKFSRYEDKKNVPWSNAYKYVLANNLLNFDRAYELLECANNIISEYQILLRENVYEEIRRDYFNSLPSRTSCIWLCKEKQLKFWQEQLKEDNYKIFMIEVFGKTFKSNNNMIVAPSDSYKQMRKMAKKYWGYKEKTEKEDDEYLYVGKIKVIKELL